MKLYASRHFSTDLETWIDFPVMGFRYTTIVVRKLNGKSLQKEIKVWVGLGNCSGVFCYYDEINIPEKLKQ